MEYIITIIGIQIIVEKRNVNIPSQEKNKDFPSQDLKK